jgi:molybdopterin converting factor subunit 1
MEPVRAVRPPVSAVVAHGCYPRFVAITLLYFAAVRELAGRSEERLELPPSVTTLGELAAYLETRIPALAGRLASVRLAQNEEMADRSAPLADGDVIALIPPVAGG